MQRDGIEVQIYIEGVFSLNGEQPARLGMDIARRIYGRGRHAVAPAKLQGIYGRMYFMDAVGCLCSAKGWLGDFLLSGFNGQNAIFPVLPIDGWPFAGPRTRGYTCLQPISGPVAPTCLARFGAAT